MGDGAGENLGVNVRQTVLTQMGCENNNIQDVTERRQSCQKTPERHGMSRKMRTCESKRFILQCVSQTGVPINK